MRKLLCLRCLREDDKASPILWVAVPTDGEDLDLDSDMRCATCGEIYHGMGDYCAQQGVGVT